jgi:hypothetical protein
MLVKNMLKVFNLNFEIDTIASAKKISNSRIFNIKIKIME